MSTEKLNTQVRQEQIVQAALSLLAGHGLKGLNMGRLARRIGLVPSAIYRHFKNKDEVLDAVLDLIRNRLLSNVRAVYAETPDSLERLRRLLMRHIQLIRENEAIPRIIFSEEVYFGDPERRAKLRNIIEGYLEKVQEILLHGQQEGRIRTDADAKTLSVMFLGLIQPAAILWHVSDGEFDVTRHGRKAWEVFSQAIQEG
jgi:AcrR family transcriptional regulator